MHKFLQAAQLRRAHVMCSCGALLTIRVVQYCFATLLAYIHSAKQLSDPMLALYKCITPTRYFL
jgi:hypothetical protein